MRWLETRLQDWNSPANLHRGPHPRAYPVWFDPWRYHSREEVWRGIIAEVILGLFAVAKHQGQNFLPRMVQAAKKFGGFLGRSFLHALANLEFSASGKAGLPGVAEGEVSLGASGEMFREIWDEYQKTTQPQKAYLNQFEESLRTWVSGFLQELTGPDEARPRLIIFIDDLDRCLPAVALEVLEALKLYLSIPHLIFVVGLDQEVVNAVVTEEYRKTGVPEGKAASYLHKLFQLELRIPPSEVRMGSYMESQLTALNKATGGYWDRTLSHTDGCLSGKEYPQARDHIRSTLRRALSRAAQLNPREVKRLLNSALIYGRSAALDPQLKKDGETAADAALRFAQGIQVRLLQHILGTRHISEQKILSYTHYLRWFEQASVLIGGFLLQSGWDIEKLAQELSDFTSPSGIKSETDPFDPPAEVSDAQKLGKDQQKQLHALLQHLTTCPPDSSSKVWLSLSFLELLQFPFDQAVAQCAPVPAPAAPPAPSGSLSQLDPILRERLAAAARVPVDQFSPDHLPGIQRLDLSGLPITSAQLRQLPPLPALRGLELHGCSGLSDLQGLPQLPQLEMLILDDCTGLQGPGCLLPLAALPALTYLYIRRCSGFSDLQGLQQLTKLERLILSGCTGLQGPGCLRPLAALPALTHLDLRDCSGVTAAEVEDLKKQVQPQRGAEKRRVEVFGP